MFKHAQTLSRVSRITYASYRVIIWFPHDRYGTRGPSPWFTIIPRNALHLCAPFYSNSGHGIHSHTFKVIHLLHHTCIPLQ